jgi:hypothetical protein
MSPKTDGFYRFFQIFSDFTDVMRFLCTPDYSLVSLTYTELLQNFTRIFSLLESQDNKKSYRESGFPALVESYPAGCNLDISSADMIDDLFLVGVQQCIREGKAVGMFGSDANDNLTQTNEGCRLHGHLEVNKVAGNFHIAPGQSFQQNHVHVHSLRNMRLNMLNSTHYIKDLSFGEYFPNQINPLSNTKQIANDGAVLFHYYVKVVPSTYVFLNQTQLITNQYSVTKHRKIIKNIHDSSDNQLPGTFFTYEISAIMVKFVEQKRSLTHFLT